MDKSVSVIIPCFNREKYIEEAVASVRRSTFLPDEVIVIDDGSTDSSMKILEDLKMADKISLLTHPGHGNRGQAASINLGLDQARGDYVAILDSDDLFAASKLEDQVTFLEANPDVGMVYGQGYAIDSDGNLLFKLLPDDHQESGDPNQLLLDCYMALPGGALVRRSAWDKAGRFEEEFRAAQDHDMALRLMEVAPVAYLPNIAFYYRKHDDAISKKGLERRWKTGFEVLDRARRRYPYRRSTIRKRSAVLNFRLGQIYWRSGERLKSIPYLLKSGLLDPKRSISVLIGREAVR